MEIVSDTNALTGIRSLQLQSEFQPAPSLVRIVAPKSSTAAETIRILFILPVEPKEGTVYGDGLQEVLKTNLHTHHNLLLVAPSFAQLPWYADHPTNPFVRHESYFIKSVLPLIDQLYPAPKRERLLIGFSKSGWGAFSLILRHPDLFKSAAAWDAPLMKEKPDQFGMADIFGTQENFERYRITTLLKDHAAPFQNSSRLWLGGYENFRTHTQDAHALLDSLKIQHAFADGPKRKHIWGSGWAEDAVKFLARPPERKD